jgi:hypothetical protein
MIDTVLVVVDKVVVVVDIVVVSYIQCVETH